MKQSSILIIAITAVTILSCNSNKEVKDDHSHMKKDNMPMQENVTNEKEIKILSASFPNVDPGVASFMKSLAGHYIGIKNALVENNTSDAASHASAMVKSLKGLDKSLFTSEQKKVYDGVADELKENAEHISEKNDLKHERSHFVMMSEDMYNLVKAFGAGMTLYHDHCPMARDNMGAMWLSEFKEIRNPYFGEKMMTCGSVESMFQ